MHLKIMHQKYHYYLEILRKVMINLNQTKRIQNQKQVKKRKSKSKIIKEQMKI